MKSLINMRAVAMMLMLMFLSGTSAWADVDDYLLSVRNVSHTANTIDFDLYLLDTDNAQTFEFAALQMGLLLNSSIYGAGTLTVSYSNSGSDLDGDQQFVGSADVVGSLPGYPGQTLIRLAANSIPPVPPGAGSGTVISSSAFGTFLAHFTITSSVSFTPNTRPGMIFCASSAVSPLFPTVLSSYINGDATSLTVAPGVDAIVDGNPLLNATLPALFNVTGTGTYCQGGAGLAVGLDGSEVGVTYNLFQDGLSINNYPGTGAALSLGIRTAGTYTVTATNAAGDEDMNGQAVITETPNNTITLTSAVGTNSQTVCINTAIADITYSTTGATGATFSGLPSGVDGAWTAGTVTINGTPTAAATSNYTITLTGGCGTVNATGTITVNPLPAVSITGSNSICVGATTTLSPTTGGTWSSSNPTVASVTATGVVTGVAAGTATFTFTATVGGCSSTTGAVTVNPLPAVSITGSSSICVGATTTLSPTTGGTWSSSNPTVASVSATGVVTGAAPGSATFTFTATVGGCSSTTAAVTVNANVTPTFNQLGPYCVGAVPGAFLTTSINGINGTWSPAAINTSSPGTTPYTFTPTAGQCATTATMNVLINSLPVVNAGSDASIPYGTTTSLNATVTGSGPFNYSWVPASSLSSADIEDPVTLNLTANTTFTLTATSQTTGCFASDDVTISVTGGALSVSVSATPNPICIGNSTQLNASPSGGSGNYDYDWISVPAGFSSSLVNPVVSPTVTTTYYVVVDDGFNTTNGQVTVTVNPLPAVSITGSNSICVGATTTLSPTTGGTWSSSNPTVASVTATGVVTGVAAGTATFTFTATAGGCSSTTAAVTVNICTRSLTLSNVFLQGLYESNGIMSQAVGDSGPQWPAGIADHITVELHSSSSYATIIYSAPDVELTTSGTAVITVPAVHSGSYYITVKHRNSVETTTATAVSFSGTTINYSFNLQSSAFGGNLGSSGDGRFLIFSGDVNQDGFVDTQDYLGIDNDAYNYLSGYLVTDVDGNGSVDTNDYLFIDNNNYNYVGTIHP